MAGRFVKEKGYEYILEAIEILKDEGMVVYLNICGDGPLKESIRRKIIEKNMTSQVTLNKTKKHEELFNLIRNADMFAMSSISEGFPMAPAEAMVLGTPVIATKVGGIPELIEDGVSGLLVEPKKPKELALAIKKLLSDQDLRKSLAINGNKRILDLFGPSYVCNNLINFYNKILETNT